MAITSELILDARQQLTDAVAALWLVKPLPSSDERVRIIDDLIKGFWQTTETLPTPLQRKQMADWLMADYMLEQHKHQRGHEYPFHTPGQAARRREREMPCGGLDTDTAWLALHKWRRDQSNKPAIPM